MNSSAAASSGSSVGSAYSSSTATCGRRASARTLTSFTVTSWMRFCQCTCGDIGNWVAGALLQAAALGSSSGMGPLSSMRRGPPRSPVQSCKARSGTRQQPRRPRPPHHPCFDRTIRRSHTVPRTPSHQIASYSASLPCARRLMGSVVFAHNDLPNPFIGQLDFPPRHGRLPWHAFDRKPDSTLLDAPEEIAFLQHGDRRRDRQNWPAAG